jgi:hypothetical protein
MESFYVVFFDKLPTSSGHMLWPKYKETGEGWFLCRVREVDIQNQIGANQNESTMKAIVEMLHDCLYQYHYAIENATTDPPRLALLDDPILDKGIRKAIRMLQSDMSASFLIYTALPPSMPEKERRFYGDLGYSPEN